MLGKWNLFVSVLPGFQTSVENDQTAAENGHVLWNFATGYYFVTQPLQLAP